jgi:hypothetical protein
MRNKILMALLVVAVMAVPAFASVQNIKVSGDITTTGLVRDGFDFGHNNITSNGRVSGSVGQNGSDSYQQLFISQTRLNVAADLTDNVQAVVGLINERPWGDEGQTENDADVDLNLAYVKLKEMLYSPLTVTVGRQNFKFGNSFVIDSAGTNNSISSNNGLNGVAADMTMRTALDAVRLDLDYNPLTITLIAAKIDANNNGPYNPNDDDVDLFGANATYNLGDSWETVTEAYFWAKTDKSASDSSITGLKADSVYVPGLRASTNLIKGLNVQGELAWQMGNKASASVTTGLGNDNIARHAMGAQFIANYMLPFEQIAKYSPVVTAVYTYVSGDKNPDNSGAGGHGLSVNDDYRAWDPMLENQAGGTIYSSIFNLSNAHIGSIAGQFKPLEDLTVKNTWTGIWLAESFDITGSCSGGTGVCGRGYFSHPLPTGSITHQVSTNDNVGQEIDTELTYAYTEDVDLGLSAGWFFPGEFFTGLNHQTASQYMAKVGVRF